MSDKWRFDPRMDYSEDNEGRNNFQRFKKSKKNNGSKKRNRSNEEDFERTFHREKRHGGR